jgi:hypothetical protein
LKVSILINRFVHFAGSETKEPGRNLRPKLKIVPNYPILRYLMGLIFFLHIYQIPQQLGIKMFCDVKNPICC